MGEQTVEPTCEQNLLTNGRTDGENFEQDHPLSSLTCDLGLKIRRQNPRVHGSGHACIGLKLELFTNSIIKLVPDPNPFSKMGPKINFGPIS